MTTIIARRTKKGAEFAWDSQMTWGNAQHQSPPKVFQNGPVTFGVAGDSRVSDLLQHALDIPEYIPGRDGLDIPRWLIRELLPEISKTLSKNDALEMDSGLSDNNSHVVIYIGGVLEVLSSNLALVGMDDPVVGVGSGSMFAKGAVMAGAGVKKAVEIAANLDVFTGGDINYLEVCND